MKSCIYREYQRANTDPTEYGLSSLGDCAIVNITSNDTITNDIVNGVQITGTYSSVPIGTTVYKYGSTTGYAWGNVLFVGLRLNYGPGDMYHVGGLTCIPMQNAAGTAAIGGGDSGGPVWRSDTGSNLIHGIITAGKDTNNTVYTTPIYYSIYQGFQPKLD